MNQNEYRPFTERLTGVYALYGKDVSKALLTIWIEALKPYDYPAICEALNRHAVNPDNGQFPPKPADIVKLIGGGTQDAALIAWSKVTHAIGAAGAYATVVFDDPVIHAVIDDMGGWPKLCGGLEVDLPFRAREFENLYRSYKRRADQLKFPPALRGLHDERNLARGFDPQAPILIGNPETAAEVMRLGISAPRVGVTVGSLLKQLPGPEK